MSKTNINLIESLEGAKYLSVSKFGSLDTIDINHPLCTARVSLFGGHLLQFTPKHDNINRLWLSPLSASDGSKAIRGGVPICWPWFAANQAQSVDEYCQQHAVDAPSHGYVRTQTWQLDTFEENEDFVELRLSPLEIAQFSYGKDLSLQMIFRFNSECKMELITHNQSTSSIEFGAALHTYFAVENIGNVLVEGVTNEYRDKTQGFKTCSGLERYAIESEVDRIHNKANIEDPEFINIVKNNENLKRISIVNQGNNAVVIWNPWMENSEALPDMTTTGYQQMICIESAIVAPIALPAMQSHCLTQIFK